MEKDDECIGRLYARNALLIPYGVITCYHGPKSRLRASTSEHKHLGNVRRNIEAEETEEPQNAAHHARREEKFGVV